MDARGDGADLLKMRAVGGENGRGLGEVVEETGAIKGAVREVAGGH